MRKLIAILVVILAISCNKSTNATEKTTIYYLKIESIDNDNSVTTSPIIPVNVIE